MQRIQKLLFYCNMQRKYLRSGAISLMYATPKVEAKNTGLDAIYDSQMLLQYKTNDLNATNSPLVALHDNISRVMLEG